MFTNSLYASQWNRQSHRWTRSNVILSEEKTNYRAEFLGPLKGNPGYEGYLNDRVAPLSAVLKEAGYATMISGKWHLGTTKEQCPSTKGFDKVFSLLQGGTLLFDYNDNRWQSLPY